jgi:lipoprotein-releasing system permease protein
VYLRSTQKNAPKREMKLEYFIAKRVLQSEREGKKVSRPIVSIAVICIALAMIVNLITVAVVTGFQNEVRKKVVGFGAHGTLTNIKSTGITETEPIIKNDELRREILAIKGVSSLSPFAYKPALLQSNSDTVWYKRKNLKDTFDLRQEIQSVLMKGVDKNFDWSFLHSHLVKGKVPNFKESQAQKEILISQKIADALHFKVGQEVKCYFVKQQPILQKFTICGIYSTGLEEFDKELIFGDLRYVQQLNDWGLTSEIVIDDTLDNNNLIVRGTAQGGNGNHAFQWNKQADTYLGFTFCADKDTTIRLIVSDFFSKPGEKDVDLAIPDTSYLKIKVRGQKDALCESGTDPNGILTKTNFSADGLSYQIKFPNKTVLVESIPGKGSYGNYIGGYEIRTNTWEGMLPTIQEISKKTQFIPTKNGEQLTTASILETHNDIFVWLGFLDINVGIILILMIVIGIINMGSAMLVMILLRTNMIGMLKAMGAKNSMVIRVFLVQASLLILRGMVWGNVIGFTFYFAQKYIGFLPLNPAVYFLNQVPVELYWWHFLILNSATLVICVFALLLPALLILKISPVKSIKFN